jgi:effector-binding domain-containing protein
VPRPGPVETAPLPPPAAASPSASPPSVTPPSAGPPPPTAQPGAPPSPAGAPSAQAAPSPTPANPSAALPTLVPDTGDQAEVAEVTLPAKPAVIISGTSSTDEGFANVRRGIERLREELSRAGIAPAGRPFAIFQQFNADNSFNFDVLIPIESAPADRTTLTNEIRFGTTPAGRALRFVHKGPYEDVDSTYDMVEVYLEAKGIVVKDPIIEEYVNDPKDAADPDLELNIYVQPQ